MLIDPLLFESMGLSTSNQRIWGKAQSKHNSGDEGGGWAPVLRLLQLAIDLMGRPDNWQVAQARMDEEILHQTLTGFS